MTATPGRGTRTPRTREVSPKVLTARLAGRVANFTAPTDEQLRADRDQTAANATGRVVNGRTPQFYGLPRLVARAVVDLGVYDAELRRRGLTP